MPRCFALLDDPSFGEPEIYACNAQAVQRRAGGDVHASGYLCEAVGAVFAARYDRGAKEEAGKGKKGRRQAESESDSEAEEKYVGKKSEKGGSKTQTSFLKLSDHIKGVNLYELLSISEGASQDEIRKAYRALALTAHPDKQTGKSEDEMKVVQERFVQIQEGYEILSDPSKRRQFDSTLDFDESLPRFKPGEGDDFYEVFDEAFKRNARFSAKRPVPEIGNEKSDAKEWKKFYDFWYAFDSWRDPVVMAQAADEDICDLNDAECRDERRWMMKENDRIARKYKQAERERMMDLVRMAEKYDPRIQAEKDGKKAAKQAEAAKRAEAQQAVQRAREEAERLKREEEEQNKAVEEQRRKEEKAIKEAAKSKVRQQRQRLRAFHPAVKNLVQMDQLNEVCTRFEEAQLKDLADRIEKVVKKKPGQAAKLIHEAIASIGLEPITSVQEEDTASTDSGPASVVEDPEVIRQRELAAKKAAKISEAEEKENAAERAKREAEKAEQKKIRDAQRAKEQAAAEVAKRKQEKNQELKIKKAEERKKREEEEAATKKEQQREEAKIKAQEQAEADRARNEALKQEQDMETILQMFVTDRMERFVLLDKATDEGLTEALTQAMAEDSSLRSALSFLKLQTSDAGLEVMLDRALSLVYQVGPVWVLGLTLDPEIRLPNAMRNRAKKERKRLQTVMQVFLNKASFAGADASAASKAQMDIADGSIEPVVYCLEMKEAEEAAKAAPAPARQEEKSEKSKPAKAKKPVKKEGEEDLDALLAAIEDPNVKAPKKKGGKKK